MPPFKERCYFPWLDSWGGRPDDIATFEDLPDVPRQMIAAAHKSPVRLTRFVPGDRCMVEVESG